MNSYMLVCEGTCNPQVKAVDAMVKTASKLRSTDENGHSSTPLTDQEFAEVRTLSHTRHATVRLNLAACVSCGTLRRFGNEMADKRPAKRG